MNPYNLAVIITPNLFRSRELTSRDLLNHGTLTDVFTLIMANVDKIIKDIDDYEKDGSLLVNKVFTSSDNINTNQTNRTLNR